MMKENNTVFGKIIRGEIPATKVYEDDKCLAFLDINPVSKGHTLLLPKEHHIWMQDVPDQLISYIFIKAKHLMSSIKEAFGCDFVQVIVEGKDVPHFHIHLIPRHFDHKVAEWEHVKYSDGEMVRFAEKIRQKIKLLS